jgi:hypothetical protein
MIKKNYNDSMMAAKVFFFPLPMKLFELAGHNPNIRYLIVLD